MKYRGPLVKYMYLYYEATLFPISNTKGIIDQQKYMYSYWDTKLYHGKDGHQIKTSLARTGNKLLSFNEFILYKILFQILAAKQKSTHGTSHTVQGIRYGTLSIDVTSPVFIGVHLHVIYNLVKSMHVLDNNFIYINFKFCTGRLKKMVMHIDIHV